VLAKPLFRQVEKLTRIEHCLAGNAADVQASASQRPALFDAGHFHPELGGPYCRYISARSSADDHKIELCCHDQLFLESGGNRRPIPLGMIDERFQPYDSSDLK
jgi:hypothetical protein